MTPTQTPAKKTLTPAQMMAPTEANPPIARHAGMPALDKSAEQISWFEFASPRWFYAPIVFYCGWLSLRYGGLRLPLLSNPMIDFAGLVGESKSAVLDTMQGKERALIAKYRKITRLEDLKASLDNALQVMTEAGLVFPLVAKPDKGMRGAGVQVIKDPEALEAYLKSFPEGGALLLQELIDEEGEAGVFYVRHPSWPKGRIISLTMKYFPRVYGDGQKSLNQLLDEDPRAQKLRRLYTERLQDRLESIIPAGESVRLAFAGNHCRGTIFRNGNPYITEQMTARFDQLAKAMGEFYVGRFDVRFGNFDDLRAGENFRIIEVNGAGGEATHIWDSRTKLTDAYKTLMQQFKYIYQIGAANRQRGFKAPSLWQLIKAWRHEKTLTKDYPITH